MTLLFSINLVTQRRGEQFTNLQIRQFSLTLRPRVRLHIKAPSQMNAPITQLRRYILWFAAYYIACIVGLSLFIHFTEIDLGSSMRLVVVMSAGMGVATKFIDSEWRAPSKRERRLLSVYCTLASVVIGLVYALISLFLLGVLADVTEFILSVLPDMPYWMWLFYLLVDVLLPYMMLMYLFGRFSEKTVKQWVEKGRLPQPGASV